MYSEIIESIISYSTYDTLKFINPTATRKLVAELLEHVVIGIHSNYKCIGDIPVRVINPFKEFNVIVHNDTYYVIYKNVKTVYVV